MWNLSSWHIWLWHLKESFEKLALNDSSFTYENETSAALGYGFRCGCLGLLHLEVITERLRREFDLDLITTAPGVVYKIIDRIGKELTKITPSRGFVVELSAATTVIIASRAEIPVSTTHCQVGSILGCGMAGGLKNIKWSLVRGILFSWFITLPFTGLLSAGLFSFGFYGPYSDYSLETSSFVNTTDILGSGSIEL